jgi:hypothetical protein
MSFKSPTENGHMTSDQANKQATKNKLLGAISGVCCDVDEICALLGYYAALSASSVPTFRDNLSVPSSRVKKSKKTA